MPVSVGNFSNPVFHGPQTTTSLPISFSAQEPLTFVTTNDTISLPISFSGG